MKIGVPRETKGGESRVALLPPQVAHLKREGHTVAVESGAGSGVNIADELYAAAGGNVVNTSQAWSGELVVKVKEMQPEDFRHLYQGVTVFSFHHLPGNPTRTRELAARDATAIGFEMVHDIEGTFPLLAPMSVIAGRMAIDEGTRLLGAKPARVLVLGAGNAGLNAARCASRMRARVMILTRSEDSRVDAREQGFSAEIATAESIEHYALEADIVVGAVFQPGQPTPKLLPRTLVARMKRGSVIVDVSIDGGGVAETSRPTTHAQPSYIEEGVMHYCVPNMPAAFPGEGALAIATAVLPFVRELAGKGIAKAVAQNSMLQAGVLLWKGRVNHPGIAEEAGLPYVPLTDDDLR
jgi:alanine dehydrogenase